MAGQSNSSRELELGPEFAGFPSVPPPEFLDALVKQRVALVLESKRAELADAPPALPAAAAGKLGGIEACAYALGLLAYGAQVAGGMARLIWHAIAG